MTLETRRYRRALQMALSVAGRAATIEECRARLSTALSDWSCWPEAPIESMVET